MLHGNTMFFWTCTMVLAWYSLKYDWKNTLILFWIPYYYHGILGSTMKFHVNMIWNTISYIIMILYTISYKKACIYHINNHMMLLHISWWIILNTISCKNNQKSMSMLFHIWYHKSYIIIFYITYISYSVHHIISKTMLFHIWYNRLYYISYCLLHHILYTISY